jgi:hypothetical protein
VDDTNSKINRMNSMEIYGENLFHHQTKKEKYIG